jgi:hypothetical protein
MTLSARRSQSSRATDPGQALIDLLGFADAVRRSQTPRPFEPLSFPVMARLVQDRRAAASTD